MVKENEEGLPTKQLNKNKKEMEKRESEECLDLQSVARIERERERRDKITDHMRLPVRRDGDE